MPNTIQVKRGLEANRAAVTPAAGEFLYTTDTKSVFVGDGTTAGGKQVGGSGGAYTEYLSRATDITLILANVGRVVVEPTVSIMIQLPNATTLVEGNNFQITNMSEQVNMFVKSSDGTYQAFVAAGQTVNVTAENVSTAAGVWVADNPNYGFSSPVSLGHSGSYTNFNINSATASMSATKMIRINFGVQQSGLTATIITKSGSTVTKGSEQFLLNFGLQASTKGFINVIMTSATTGIISTMAPNESGTSAIFLYTFSVSGSDVVQITGQRSFDSNPGSTAKGISLTTLSSTSVIITYPTATAYNSRILTLSSGLITAVGPLYTINGDVNIYYPQVVALTSTVVVTGYFDRVSGDFYVIQANISGGTTINWSTPVLVTTGATDHDFHSISRLSATEFIIAVRKFATIVSNYGTAIGGVITLGAQNSYTNGSAIYGTMSYPISSTSALVVYYNYDATGVNDKPFAFVLTKSGTSLTRGTVYTLATSPTPTLINPSPFSLKGFVAFDPIQQPSTDFYMDYAASRFVFAVPLSVSGTVVTPVTGVLITPENVSSTAICTLSKTRAIAFVYYNAAPDGTLGSRLHLLDTSGARPVVIATDSSISTAAVFCAGQLTATRAMIAYAVNVNTAPTIRTLDITGNTFTFNSSITGSIFIGARPAICKINSTKAMIYLANNATTHRIYNIAISGTTLTQSASFVTTGDNAAQGASSRRLLYNYGDVGYFYKVVSGIAAVLTFDVSGVSPATEVTSTTSHTNLILPQYTALSGAGTLIALGATSSGSLTAAIYATIDGNAKAFLNLVSPEYNGQGITMPFSANSIMICGNGVNCYGKFIISPSSVATFTNDTLVNQVRAFNPTLSMHEPIQDWVDGDYFVPNTNKILFVGRNNVNQQQEMYHVFDKGAAQ